MKIKLLCVFTFASCFASASTQPAVTPSPDLLAHRTATHARHLRTVVEPRTDFPIGFVHQYEILKNYLDQRPDRQNALFERLDRVVDTVGRGHKAAPGLAGLSVGAEIEHNEADWQRVLAEVREEPWASFDWALLVAPRLTAAEVRLAKSLGVDVGAVFSLVDHALPSAGGIAALLRALSQPLADDQVPLYSTERVGWLVQDVRRASGSLARTIELAHEKEPSWEDLVQPLVQIAGLRYYENYNHALYKFHFNRNEPATKAFRYNAFAYAADYVRAYERMMLIANNAARLDPSPLRNEIEVVARHLASELAFELKTLPARIKHGAVLVSSGRREWDSPEWLSGASFFEGESDRDQWLALLARVDPPAAKAGCVPDLVGQSN